MNDLSTSIDEMSLEKSIAKSMQGMQLEDTDTYGPPITKLQGVCNKEYVFDST